MLGLHSQCDWTRHFAKSVKPWTSQLQSLDFQRIKTPILQSRTPCGRRNKSHIYWHEDFRLPLFFGMLVNPFPSLLVTQSMTHSRATARSWTHHLHTAPRACNNSLIYWFQIIFTPFTVRPQALSLAEYSKQGLIYHFTKYCISTSPRSFLLLTHPATRYAPFLVCSKSATR